MTARPLSEILASAQAAATRAAERAPEEPPPPDPAVLAQRREQRAAALAEIHARRFFDACPARFRSAELADLGDPEGSKISAWVAAPHGRNLILCGPVGCGKTHAAMAAARERACGGASVEISSAVALLDQLRPGGPPGTLERVCAADLLVLDDLGAERPTDWTSERMAAVVDRRWLDERPIIGTTNLTVGPRGELIGAIGERSYSRLVGSEAVVLQLAGADRRRKR